MSKAEPLYRLQNIDTELDKIAKRVREIDAAIKNNQAVNHARQELESLQKVHQRAAAEFKSIELDARGLDDKLIEEEERLYGGKIKATKELLDIQQEIDHMKRRRATIEEKLLVAMVTVDEARTAENACALALKQALKRWEEDNQAMRQEDAELRRRYASLAEQRKSLMSLISPSDVAVYVGIRTKKQNGQAVALIRNRACAACGVEPSQQIAQQAKTGTTLALCPLCGRILHSP